MEEKFKETIRKGAQGQKSLRRREGKTTVHTGPALGRHRSISFNTTGEIEDSKGGTGGKFEGMEPGVLQGPGGWL